RDSAFIFAGWKPGGVLLGRRETRQLGSLREVRRHDQCAPPHYRRRRRRIPSLVSRRPRDRFLEARPAGARYLLDFAARRAGTEPRRFRCGVFRGGVVARWKIPGGCEIPPGPGGRGRCRRAGSAAFGWWRNAFVPAPSSRPVVSLSCLLSGWPRASLCLV